MTEDGFELHAAANHLSLFLLSNLFLPLFHKTIQIKRINELSQIQKDSQKAKVDSEVYNGNGRLNV